MNMLIAITETNTREEKVLIQEDKQLQLDRANLIAGLWTLKQFHSFESNCIYHLNGKITIELKKAETFNDLVCTHCISGTAIPIN